MPDWVSTRTAVTPDGAACTGPRNHILHPNGPDLRSGEVLVYQARPSQWTNPLIVVFVIGSFVALFNGAWFMTAVWIILAMAVYVKRAFPFHYITNERVIQVDLVSNSATLEATSVELGRITSVRLFDPIFGSFIGIQRVEVFLAEGQKPKIVIPFQHRAVQIRALLDPRR